jgi:protein-L-isoaspartate(D-aspartate) O-methyltransferase
MKPMTDRHLTILRRHMVEIVAMHAELTSDETGKEELDERVIGAMLRVPRHLFVPAQLAAMAYHDTPLPIGFDKTISQPFIAALMLDLLGARSTDRVLEVGTGLGYQAALLAELTGEVFSVEIVEEFGSEAALRLGHLGYDNITLRIGDGSRGWAEHAPFERILVTAAAKQPPKALIDQLRPGGRMVLPVGPEEAQKLTVVDKKGGGEIETRTIMPVRFTMLETAA